jgi:O-antigen/teichoic acid export membrane protein
VASGAGTGRFHKGLARILMRAFVPAAIAQYIHNVIVMLEVLVLGYVSGEYQTGLFAFAFTIAAQANTVVAYQLGVVLQPIFGRLQDDPARQVSGFLRVQRVLGLVCVPISLTQAVLAEPLFRIAFAERYLPAVPVFQVISVAQAFYFATGPSMSCLRSQRRFTTFFWWQGVQLLISLPLYWVGAQWSGALGTAVASGVAWAVSAPIVVWLCTSVVKGAHAGAVLGIFIKPWLVGLPIFAAAGLGVHWLAQFGSTGDLASLFVLGPAAALGAIGAASLFDAEMRTLSGRAFGAVKSRLSRKGR